MPIMRNTVSVDIYDTPMRALVDTGASFLCITSSLVTRLGIDKSSIQSTNATDAVAVEGKVHRSLGVLSLPICFDGFVFTHDFQVFDKIHQPLFLKLRSFKSK